MALAGVDATLLPYTVDMAPAKSGCRIPGANVPIWPVEQLIDDEPAVVVVLTWDIASRSDHQPASLGADSALGSPVLGALAETWLCHGLMS